MNGRDHLDTARSLIESSSLSTGGARELRERTAHDIVDSIRRRAQELRQDQEEIADLNMDCDQGYPISGRQTSTPGHPMTSTGQAFSK